MRRVGLMLCLLLVAASSGCAFGLTRPPSGVTGTGAVLNGSVVSTRGGDGSYYFEFGTTALRLPKLPAHPIELGEGSSSSVSQSVNALEWGSIYSYRLCAEDGDNAGYPICVGGRQHFTTPGERITAHLDCFFYPPDHMAEAHVVTQPGTDFRLSWDGPMEEGTDTFSVGPAGYLIVSFPRHTAGVWTFTAELPGGTFSDSVSADCSAATRRRAAPDLGEAAVPNRVVVR